MRPLRRFLKFLGALAFWFVVVSVCWVALLGVADPPVTWVMLEQAGEQKNFHRTNAPLERMARSMPLAVIAAEDQLFMTHHGFEWKAIERAMEHNRRGKRTRGASTISQQTAKNVFLWPGRTFVRKGLEAWFTVLIEVLWSKDRILEVYLNVAEMGPGIFGAEAAAQRCFDRPASRLTPYQCALIAASLPGPRRSSCAKRTSYIERRAQWVMRQMRHIGDVMEPEARERQKERRREREEKEEARKKNRK